MDLEKLNAIHLTSSGVPLTQRADHENRKNEIQLVDFDMSTSDVSHDLVSDRDLNNMHNVPPSLEIKTTSDIRNLNILLAKLSPDKKI